MAVNLSEVVWNYRLDLGGIPSEDREAAKAEVLDYLKDKVLDYLAQGKSPVTGGKFKPLSKEYKDEKSKISGSTLPNMELNGNLLAALETWDKGGDRIAIGWTDEDEVPKAFNHTTGDTLPERPLIPRPGDEFASEIMRGIEGILDEHRTGESDD